MIIKKIKIDNFGKIKDFSLNLSSGTNLIYGENEKGKSTIQNFIKAMLYGIPTKKEKGNLYSLRERYSSASGEKIGGELLVSYKSEEYIIKRSFGRTKKEDFSKIFDAITGEEVKIFDLEEPGKNFLGVNSSTFTKTLFISQLGVEVEKDKEEEIMDRIINLFHNGENEVSIEKAIDVLNKNIKSLTTLRKVGILDALKEKKDILLQEKFEAYKIAEETLEKEKRLNEALDEKLNCKSEISNLELYKKHLKKLKLQKEYREILEYLKKSEELKNKKNDLMKDSNEIINEEFLNDITEENNNYLNLLDIKNQAINDNDSNEEALNEINNLAEEYGFFKAYKGDFKEDILTLKIQQESIKENINISNELVKSIKETKKEYDSIKEVIPFYNELKNNNKNIIESLSVYEENLREFHDKNQGESRGNILENKHKNLKRNKLIYGSGIGIACLVIISGSLLNLGFVATLIGVVLLIAFGVQFNKVLVEERNLQVQLKEQESINKLKEEIEEIERELLVFGKQIGAKKYEDLIYKLKSFENVTLKLEKLEIKIEAKEEELKSRGVEENRIKYNQNNMFLKEWLDKSNSTSIEELLSKYDEYMRNIAKLEVKRNEKENRREYIDRISRELIDKEESIKRKLLQIDLGHIDMLDVSYYIKELRVKLKKKNEVLVELNSIEQTYLALIKERDINEIKDEVKELLDVNMDYSYNNEEEIEDEIKKRSEFLINIEKEIRDLKNFIDNRFLGKRKIVEVEEDLRVIEEEIKEKELKLKALVVACEKMKETSFSIRGKIGPLLNHNIVKNIRCLAGENFDEVLLAEDYTMKVRKNGAIFPAEFLSNGAKDQLYLSLRLAFSNNIFKGTEYPLFFDDAFVQYDDERRDNVLNFIDSLNINQILIFTCHKIEKQLLEKNKIDFNYITL